MSVEEARVTALNDREAAAGDYVLYWMQQSQRAEENPALEFAAARANAAGRPLVVGFGLTDGYPEANLRHYRFMLEGLAETCAELSRRGIRLVVRRGDPAVVAVQLAGRAAAVICDVGYTRHQRAWRREVAAQAPCRVFQVEGDVVVPVAVVSDKAEYAARTIRPRIQKYLETYLRPVKKVRLKHPSLEMGLQGLDLSDLNGLLGELTIDRGVPPVTRFFKGGPGEARRRVRGFIRQRLARYEGHRNQPQTDDISHMSPFLHFGQISPVALALAVRAADTGTGADRAAFLEELIVRRELAVNWAHYSPDYDHFAGLPAWARRSLAAHAGDPREHRYDRETLAAAATHDPYWNAAMQEMVHTGFMHNYMRMYWGKKILEWSASPEEAFATALFLNNRFFLDGRDPNSYAGVGWVFGLHDRPWFERPIFGTVRYMAAGGLERKCDIRGYVAKVDRLTAQARGD
jgi:deoxyribodipyrimidine photo-lyase